MIIALDAMGGDFAPAEIVKGALLAAGQLEEARVALVGDEAQIKAALGNRVLPDNLFIRHASEVVEMEDSPRVALRKKPDSSMARAVDMVLEGEAEACVSAGNSGAWMALCYTRLGSIPGIDRPAIALFCPTPSGPRLLLDAGAVTDCKPFHLQQFGIMGSVYAEFAMGCKQPRVGLLNIGEEAHKGNELTLAASQLLKSSPINFVGNIEGDHIFVEGVDVIVCDGFVGNVALKVMEGLAGMLMGTFRDGIKKSLLAKLGALLMLPVFRKARKLFDYRTYGGALLLGINGICIIGHGKSDSQAVCNALLVAERSVKAKVIEHMLEMTEQLIPDSESELPLAT